jgi:hypothetical protein
MTTSYAYYDLKCLRRQLALAIDFAEATPNDGMPHHSACWWAGDFPAYPQDYAPDDWQKHNRPIWAVWEDYVATLEDQGLDDYADLAKQLPIADLLEASRAEDPSYRG